MYMWWTTLRTTHIRGLGATAIRGTGTCTALPMWAGAAGMAAGTIPSGMTHTPGDGHGAGHGLPDGATAGVPDGDMAGDMAGDRR